MVDRCGALGASNQRRNPAGYPDTRAPRRSGRACCGAQNRRFCRVLARTADPRIARYQPPTLLTNAISFHEYSKARLYSQSQGNVDNEGGKSVQLTQRLFATGTFSLFGFRELATTKLETKTNKDDFDSVWE